MKASVPFRAYAHLWVRKEIQRAIAEQEFAASVPPGLAGPLVALRGLVDRESGRLELAAAALDLSPATILALYRQLATTKIIDGSGEDEDDYALPDPGFDDPESAAIAGSMLSVLRRAFATLEWDLAQALILRYGLDGEAKGSFREVGRHLGCSDHTARTLVARAQWRLRAAID